MFLRDWLLTQKNTHDFDDRWHIGWQQILTQEPIPLRNRRPDVPENLAAAILRALKAPTTRCNYAPQIINQSLVAVANKTDAKEDITAVLVGNKQRSALIIVGGARKLAWSMSSSRIGHDLLH